MNLTTLCSVKAYMGIPSSDTSRDGVINAMIPGTSKAATKFMGRRFGEYRYTEYYSGNGTAQLVLNHTPVSPTDLEVWVDPTGAWGQGPSPAFPDADKLDVGTYALELDTPEGLSGSGILVRIGNVWPFAATRYWLNQSPPLSADGTIRSGNIKVAYTAGEPVPDDVTLACNMAISYFMNANQAGGFITSEQYEDYSRQVALPQTGNTIYSLPAQSLAILANYRDLSRLFG